MKTVVTLVGLIIARCFICPGMLFAGKKTMDINTANKLLAKTIVIGYTFDAPVEGAWGNKITPEELKNIKSAGFTAIRLPVQWVARMDSVAPYTIKPAFLERIDEVIKQSTKMGLAVVVENCLDQQLMSQPEKYKNRFISLWEQLSLHYASFPQSVMFEIMAEPHAKLSDVWENYFTGALDVIRKNNPSRPVIIGPVFYNNLHYLNSLRLPQNDHFIIVTYHMYEPIQFAMQGEKWLPYGKPMEWLGTKWTGTAAEQKLITDNMDMVSKWAADNNRPVFMGEFGASDHADIDSRAKFLQFYREQAELRHFSWGVWSYSVGFSIYDNKASQWRSSLLNALIPASPSKQ